MKARASFTIEADVLARLDSVVDNINYRSKSEAVEDILRKFFERQHTAIIMCGGNFKLENSDIYKPLVRIGNSTLIEDTVTKLRMNGFRNIFVSGSTGLLKEVFKILKNGEGYGVDVKYVDDDNMKGSARALERVKEYVGSTTLFVPGDAVFDLDLRDMLRFHSTHNSMASIAVSTLPDGRVEDTHDRLVIKGNKIVLYEKGGGSPVSRLDPTSIFLLDKEVFKYIPPGDMEWDIRRDMLPLMAKEGILYGYIYNGSWVRIRKGEDIETAKAIMKKQQSF